MYKIYTRKPGIASCYIHKLWMIMRLTTLLLFVSLLQVSAAGLAQKITINERKATIEKVLKIICVQSGYDIFYDGKDLNRLPLLNISVKNASLEEALKATLDSQPISYTIEGKVVVIARKKPSIIDAVKDYLLSYTLHGMVLDENGHRLVGANVMIMNDHRGYGVAEDGRFELDDINGDETLITTYLGYKTDTLKLHGEHSVTITMRPQSAKLEEVAIVNTGYQKLAKDRVSGSYGKPDMQLFANRVGTTDVINRLEGLVPGVTVKAGPQGSGANRNGTGSNQRSIVRGISSVTLNTDPLYVLDGLQVPNLSNLNPNDIGDITVLKDAAAAAIYGVKSANGVIVITTKSGKKDGKVAINYNGYFTLSGKPRFKKNYYLNSAEYIQTAIETFDPQTNPYSIYDAYAPHELILYRENAGTISGAQATKSLDSLSGLDNRKQIQDLFYRNSFTTNHSLSASAGNQVYSVYSSISYTNNYSTTPGESSNNYLLNLNQNINPTKWLSIGLNTSFNNIRSKSKHPVSVGAAFLPYQLFEDANGNPLMINYMNQLSAERKDDFQARSRINLDYVPLDEINKGYTNTNLFNINTTGNVGVKFWKGLSFQGTYGYRKASGPSDSYLDHSSMEMRNELLRFTLANTPNDVPKYLLPEYGGTLRSKETNSQNWTLRNQLVFTSSLRGGKDNINIQIGQEAVENSDRLATTILRGYDDELKTFALIDYVGLAKPIFGAVGSGYSSLYEKPFELINEKRRFTSLFGLFNYSINDRYMIDASVRQDKSSNFASISSKQKKPAYSIGGKWQLYKENFMQSLSWINNLGLRTTYGTNGNAPTSSATIYDILYASKDPNLGDSFSVNSVANRNLSWETTRTLNFGVDFAVLNNRLSGNIDLYLRNTTDLLGQVKYNPLTGTETTTGNVGNIKNNGIEFALNSRNLNIRNFGWTTGLVFSYNYNKLVSYSDPADYQLSASSRTNANYEIGYPIQPIFAYRYAGLDNLGDPQIFKADGSVTKDPNAAAKDDLVFMGTTQPKFNGGLTNTFRYKSLSLSANMIYNFGAIFRKPTELRYGRLTASSFSDGNVKASFADRWKTPGDEDHTNIPSYAANPSINYGRRNLDYYTYADINVISGDYIKLRDVTLSYDLPPNVLRALGLQRVSAYVQTGNFLIWKANKDGLDPEYIGDRLTDRNYSLGLNVSF